MIQNDVLAQTETYCKYVILIHAGSTLNDVIILLITPIYLEQELNTSHYQLLII